MCKIKKVKTISRDDIESIFNGDLLAIHIPGFFDGKQAKLASQYLLEKFESKEWPIGGPVHYQTDMSYLLGIPRSLVLNNLKTEDAYHEAALSFLEQLSLAFLKPKTPLEQFKDELELAYNAPLLIENLNGRSGLSAIVRYLSSENYKSNAFPLEGICHTDSTITNKFLSVNIYLSMPPEGGGLKIWNLPKESKFEKSSLSKLIKNFAFDPNYSNKIQSFLPLPEIITPEAGDLIIFDTSLPHAVTGFIDGDRVTIQTFIKAIDNGIAIFS